VVKRAGAVVVLLILAACTSTQSAGPTTSPDAAVDPPDGEARGDGGRDASEALDASGVLGASEAGLLPVPGNLRVVAANISSGPSLDYGAAEGVRIFQGLHPDVVLIQEFVVRGNSAAEVDSFVGTTFGAGFTYYREPGMQIPNGIISRYPILDAGTWADPAVSNRGFAYAKLDLPGPHPLWAISLHLLTTGASQRASEVSALVAQVKAVIPAADYLVLGGDFNTPARSEACITGLSEVVVTTGPYPADGAGNDNTSGPRTKPHDWLLADTDLAAFGLPVAVGQRAYAGGLVFDSRVFTPLADVAPVQSTDSAAQNMQHMPVVRDFLVPK